MTFFLMWAKIPKLCFIIFGAVLVVAWFLYKKVVLIWMGSEFQFSSQQEVILLPCQPMEERAAFHTMPVSSSLMLTVWESEVVLDVPRPHILFFTYLFDPEKPLISTEHAFNFEDAVSRTNALGLVCSFDDDGDQLTESTVAIVPWQMWDKSGLHVKCDLPATNVSRFTVTLSNDWGATNASFCQAKRRPVAAYDLVVCSKVVYGAADRVWIEEWARHTLRSGASQIFLFYREPTRPEFIPVIQGVIALSVPMFHPALQHQNTSSNLWGEIDQLCLENKCLMAQRHNTKFVAHFDVDEFILWPQSLAVPPLTSLINDIPSTVSSVSIPWCYALQHRVAGGVVQKGATCCFEGMCCVIV